MSFELSRLTGGSNIVGIICGVLTPYMINPSAWDWGNYAGFFWVSADSMFAIFTGIR